MERPKQQAMMFLLGAVLVGGALGFSADRYIGHEKFALQYGPRSKFYDDLGLSSRQRSTLDSLAFEHECAFKALVAPQDSAIKTLNARFRAARDSVFTHDQLTRLAARRKDMEARREAERAKEPKRQCSGK